MSSATADRRRQRPRASLSSWWDDMTALLLYTASFADGAVALSMMPMIVEHKHHVTIATAAALFYYQLMYLVPQLFSTVWAEAVARRAGAALTLVVSLAASALSVYVVSQSLLHRSVGLYYAARLLNGVLRHDKLLFQLVGSGSGSRRCAAVDAARLRTCALLGGVAGLVAAGVAGDVSGGDVAAITRAFALVEVAAASAVLLASLCTPAQRTRRRDAVMDVDDDDDGHEHDDSNKKTSTTTTTASATTSSPPQHGRRRPRRDRGGGADDAAVAVVAPYVRWLRHEAADVLQWPLLLPSSPQGVAMSTSREGKSSNASTPISKHITVTPRKRRTPSTAHGAGDAVAASAAVVRSSRPSWRVYALLYMCVAVASGVYQCMYALKPQDLHTSYTFTGVHLAVVLLLQSVLVPRAVPLLRQSLSLWLTARQRHTTTTTMMNTRRGATASASPSSLLLLGCALWLFCGVWVMPRVERVTAAMAADASATTANTTLTPFAQLSQRTRHTAAVMTYVTVACLGVDVPAAMVLTLLAECATARVAAAHCTSLKKLLLHLGQCARLFSAPLRIAATARLRHVVAYPLDIVCLPLLLFVCVHAWRPRSPVITAATTAVLVCVVASVMQGRASSVAQ